MKPKILFLLRLPPRLTGATLMNSFVQESELLQQHFRIKTIRMPHAKSHDEVGELSVRKLTEILITSLKLFFTLLIYRPRFVYFQMSPLGGAFIRDLIYVVVIKLTRTKIVHHMHGKGIAQEHKKRFFKPMFKIAFKNSSVICLAESLTNDLKEVNTGKPYIVPNVIKIDLNEMPDHHYSDKLRILYVSNLYIAKGINVFIESMARLKESDIPFEAHIIGNPSEITKEQLLEKIKSHDLSESEVRYLGPKYDQEKWNEYKWANVLVFPTLNDIWGLVILEAMQAAIPVIASIDGAIPEIINDGETGFLVEKGDVNSIADKLEYLFYHPEKAEKMGKNGRKYFLENYSYPKFEKKMLQVFQSVINS